MNSAVDFGQILADTTDMSRRMMQIGQQIERDRLVPHMQAIFNAYRAALTNAKYTMPPALHLALANAQREVGEMRKLEPARNFVGEADNVSDRARLAGL